MLAAALLGLSLSLQATQQVSIPVSPSVAQPTDTSATAVRAVKSPVIDERKPRLTQPSTDIGGGTGGASWTNTNTTDTIRVQHFLNDTEFGAVVELAANTTSDQKSGYGITDGGYFRVWYYNGFGDGPQATSNTVGF